jgi:hypothetical protein
VRALAGEHPTSIRQQSDASLLGEWEPTGVTDWIFYPSAAIGLQAEPREHLFAPSAHPAVGPNAGRFVPPVVCLDLLTTRRTRGFVPEATDDVVPDRLTGGSPLPTLTGHGVDGVHRTGVYV